MLIRQHTETYVGTIKEDYCIICFYENKLYKTSYTVIFLYCTYICFCVLTNQHTSTGFLMEDYCIICFYLYSSELVSLGSFVSKRLNIYFEQ